MDDTLRNHPGLALLTLEHYQSRAIDTAAYPGRGNYQVIYPAIALAGEAGELAKAVSAVAERDLEPHVHFMALDALDVVETCGAVMELVKKAYRNEPAGELTPERKEQLRTAIEAAHEALDVLCVAVGKADRFEFPPLPLAAKDVDPLVKEAGDALWYVACFCTEARVSLGYVGEVNYIKLADRARRDAIRSTGDNR